MVQVAQLLKSRIRFAVPDVYTNSLAGLLFSWRRQLSLAPFLARLEGADVPSLILSMDGAEPPPADAAVGRCGRIAGLIHGRNRLTGPLEAPGISLVRLLQHSPPRAGSIHLALVAEFQWGRPTLPITSFGCSRPLAMTASSGTHDCLAAAVGWTASVYKGYERPAQSRAPETNHDIAVILKEYSV